MTQPPGWFPDPFGRYVQRYHDGTAWTAHVVGPAGPLLDPLGASTVVPFLLPATARANPSAWPPPNAADRRG